MKITKSKNVVRSFYYAKGTDTISDPLTKLYLSSGYKILGRGGNGRVRKSARGELAVCWCQVDGKVFASLNRIEDPEFDTTNDVGYATLWGNPTGSKYKTKVKIKELVPPMYVFDSTEVKKLGNPVMDNAPAVMKVCEELLKHL